MAQRQEGLQEARKRHCAHVPGGVLVYGSWLVVGGGLYWLLLVSYCQRQKIVIAISCLLVGGIIAGYCWLVAAG